MTTRLDTYFHTKVHKKPSQMRKEFDEFLKQFQPKAIEEWYENGVKVTKYESR